MYDEDENLNDVNSSPSKLDKKNETKYNNPLYNFVTSFFIHIIYLFIFLLFIYSIILYHSQIFNSGLFDNIFNNILFGGYCTPFSKLTPENKEKLSLDENDDDKDKSKYPYVSLINLIHFDYIDINSCVEDNSEKIENENDKENDHAYSYGLVTFNKKYISYLYKYFGFNLSNLISYINYGGKNTDNKIVYSYNDNLGFPSARKIFGLNIFWVISDLMICLPLMFCLDTIRKAFAYNIIIYTIIYKLLYNWINEGLLLVIFGFLFIYYPGSTISLLLTIPCFISGISFLLVIICNFVLQIYNYTMYSIKINNELNKHYTSTLDIQFFKSATVARIIIMRGVLTFLKVITVAAFMLWYGITISQMFVGFLSIYMIFFLYLIIPIYFKGNTLSKDITKLNLSSDNENTDNVIGDESGDGPTDDVIGDNGTTDNGTTGDVTTGDVTTDNGTTGDVTTDNGTTGDVTTGGTGDGSSDGTGDGSGDGSGDGINIDGSGDGSGDGTSDGINIDGSGDETTGTSDGSDNIVSSESKNPINIDQYVNSKEDYSLLSVWYSILYKKRYIYLLIFIIFSIDFTYSGILSDTYNWLVIFGLIILILFLGKYVNKLICKPIKEENNTSEVVDGNIEMIEQTNIQTGGGVMDYFKNFKFYRPIKYELEDFKFNFFSDKNPFKELKEIKKSKHFKEYIENNKCTLDIKSNAYTHNNFEKMLFTKILGEDYDSSSSSSPNPLSALSTLSSSADNLSSLSASADNPPSLSTLSASDDNPPSLSTLSTLSASADKSSSSSPVNQFDDDSDFNSSKYEKTSGMAKIIIGLIDYLLNI
jgi:hypothetical protein